MKKKKPKPRVCVLLTCNCGNYGDVASTIKVSRRRWQAINAGEEYSTTASYYYEGGRYTAWWQFADGLFSIGGDDGLELVVDAPISELEVEIKTVG